MMIKVYVIIISLFTCSFLCAQDATKIEGIISDYLTQVPVGEANISIKGMEGRYVISDNVGKFSIEVPSLFTVLVVTYPGYQTKEYALFGKTEVEIRLVPEDYDVDEYSVRLPYYTMNTKNLNGAYSVVYGGNDMTMRYRDIDQMMQGGVAGLQSHAYSGVPGEGSVYSIRGVRSLYNSNAPLIIIDGIPLLDQVFDELTARGNVYNFLSDINVKDIESITVLRDVSAAGIYGSRASNGAIVITTKEGTSGKTFLDVSVQQGISTRYNELPVMNSDEYVSYMTGKLYRENYSQWEVQQMFPYLSSTDPSSYAYWKYANNTNWQKEVTRNAFFQDYYLGLRGGDATSKYSLNVGYNDMEGVVRGISADLFATRFNLDFRITPKISSGLRIAFSRRNKELMDQGDEERVNPLYLSLAKPPILSPFEKNDHGIDGPNYNQPDYDNLSNPLAVTTGVINKVLHTWIVGQVFAQYDFKKNLNTRLSLNIDRRGLEEWRFTPAKGIVPLNNDIRYDRIKEEQFLKHQIISIEHILSYNKQLHPDHRLMAFGGYNFETGTYLLEFASAIHSPSDDFQRLNDGLRDGLRGYNDTHHNVSFFANADYAFREKVLFKTGLRMDGSSMFGKEGNSGVKIGKMPFAVLPYAGITWRMKSESWMSELNFLDELDIRTSWGLSANQNIPYTVRYSLFETSYYTNKPGVAPYIIGNNAIEWEKTNNFNLGVDLSVLDKIMGIRMDFFNTKTTDLLRPEVLNATTGEIYSWINGGTLTNNGIEMELYTQGFANDLKWNLSFNIAKYNAKISDLALSVIEENYGMSTLMQNGSEPSLIYGYNCLGVFSTDNETGGLLNNRGEKYEAGDFQFEDLNKDGIINDLDMQVIGNPNPDFFGGIFAGLNYKNFGLDARFTYSYGSDILNVLRMKLETGDTYENQSKALLNQWSTEGDNADMPFTRFGSSSANRLPSSHYIEDGSYFKLKSVTLSYNVKQQISFVRNAQLYITAYNLFTVSKYLGWDPEVAYGHNVFTRGYDFGYYPQARMFMLGVKLGL